MFITGCVRGKRCILCVLCLCLIISGGESLEIQPKPNATQGSHSPLEFPNRTEATVPILVGNKPNLEFPTKTDDSTPILIGNNPKNTNLPPKFFPTKQEKESTGVSIITGTNVKTMNLSQSKEGEKLNLTNEKISEKVNTTIEDDKTSGNPQDSNDKVKVEQPTAEQEDMLHSKYKGGQDVDELRPEKKASEKDPKTEVSVSPTLDKNGPKSMNESKAKSGESMLESTSKMMAVSSSVLANTQPKEHGLIEPVKTMVSVLLSVVALLCFGAIGLLVWKRIAMRRFGRDVLINEDDFDDVADMHTFDTAQIQIT